MKNTVKIDYERQRFGNAPIIKIFTAKRETPVSVDFYDDEDDDPRDKLVNDFLHTPLNVNKNHFFELGSYFPVQNGNITTIIPIAEESLFYRFRNAILNRIVPNSTSDLFVCDRDAEGNIYKSDKSTIRSYYPREEEMIKINEFFDWLSTLEYHNERKSND